MLKVTNSASSVEGVIYTQSSSVWIGTQTNHELIFGTNFTGSESLSMTYTVTGRLGVGERTPLATVHAVGGGTSASTILQANGHFRVTGDGVVHWGAYAAQGKFTWDTNRAIIESLNGSRLDLKAGGSIGLTVSASAGRVGVGAVTAPTALLHIAGGGTAGWSASLKLGAGSLLTTPEIGAMEFDGSSLYFSRLAGVRKRISLKTYAIIGNAVDTVFTINHLLGTNSPSVVVRYEAGVKKRVEVDWEWVDSDNVKLTFTEPPATNEFRVSVEG